MHFEISVNLDATLGCGQAHRWHKENNGDWTGMIERDIVTLKGTENGFDCRGCSNRINIERYFRSQDNLSEIYDEISSADPYVADLAHKCPGMRILEQPKWECLATYILATCCNISRIKKMTTSLCTLCGKNLGKIYSFPSPREIINKEEELPFCRLGFREKRLSTLAHNIEDGILNLEKLSEYNTKDLTDTLKTFDGVGPKVADCVALFAYGRLESFPVDSRISNTLKEIYDISGSYRKMSSFGQQKFGKYAGYAQELLYHRFPIVQSFSEIS